MPEQLLGYDLANRLSSITNAAGAYAYTYGTPGGLIQKLACPNGAYLTNVHDSLKRVTDIYLRNSAHTDLSRHSYQYNAVNWRTKHTRLNGDYDD